MNSKLQFKKMIMRFLTLILSLSLILQLIFLFKYFNKNEKATILNNDGNIPSETDNFDKFTHTENENASGKTATNNKTERQKYIQDIAILQKITITGKNSDETVKAGEKSETDENNEKGEKGKIDEKITIYEEQPIFNPALENKDKISKIINQKLNAISVENQQNQAASAEQSEKSGSEQLDKTPPKWFKKWTLSHQADPLFNENFFTAVQACRQYRISPLILLAQTALETNFMHFDGVISSDFHNPCGLKTASAVDDSPEAHMKFSSWTDGFRAQAQHLALYAGHEDFPLKSGNLDPRNFPYLAGTATTALALGQKWAPASHYGDSLLIYINEMISFMLEEK